MIAANINMGSFDQLKYSTFQSHINRRNQGKERIRRAEEIVMPEIKRLKPLVSKRVFENMKTSNIRGDKKFLIEYHAKTCSQLVCFLVKFKALMYVFISLPLNTTADCATGRTLQAVQMQTITLYRYSNNISAPFLRWLHNCFVKTLSTPNAIRF